MGGGLGEAVRRQPRLRLGGRGEVTLPVEPGATGPCDDPQAGTHQQQDEAEQDELERLESAAGQPSRHDGSMGLGKSGGGQGKEKRREGKRAEAGHAPAFARRGRAPFPLHAILRTASAPQPRATRCSP